ncbi:SusC/RagA family TonB-linked outer membrane protein [Massilibacteroides vaginae]|uniref:SusC/RagA family TonB-linked outer membrane protein n=1 Tax=Massilibacteroides vaginae TaxID=1673718 RepID=UPI000A1C9C95|nr:TonB-dependent receptor [Massilibacteroides vaginae]
MRKHVLKPHKWYGFLLAFLLVFTENYAVLSQSQIVSGKVIDQIGDPLIGVNVVVKDLPGTGTITDLNGMYTLDVQGEKTIVFTYIGYASQEININGRKVIDVTLLEDTEALEEVIVVGYGSQSKRRVTTAISSVNSEAIARSSSTTTAGALSGKMAGVSTRAIDSRPGRGINVEIRNMGKPLFVIDGIPYGGATGRDWLGTSNVSGEDAFNALSLEDIESISILKDASASVYGLRAANGVVLVTTKRGLKEDKVSVNVNGHYGWQNLTRFPQLANAGQYVRGLVEAEQNDGKDPSRLYSREELDKWMNGTEEGYKSYDYYDIIMRKNVPQYNINANITGGSKRSNYYISLAHTGQEAMMKDFDYKRTNLQVNIETMINKRLTIGTQTSARMEDTRDVGLPGGDGYFSSILSLFSSIPTYGPYANDNPQYMNAIPNRPDLNPALFSRDIAGYKDNFTKNININLYGEYKFDFGLSAKFTYSHNYTHLDFNGFQYSYDFYTYDKISDTYNLGGGQSARWRYEADANVLARYGQFQLNYTKSFGDHNLSTVFAYERSDYDRSTKWSNTAPTNNYIPFKTLPELTGYGEGWNYEARSGYIARLNYSYRDKYMLEFLARYDASYLYAPGKRWGFFPGVSAGWRISDETFFLNIKKVISDLKLRGSVGQTGSEAGVNMFGYIGGYDYNSGGAVLDGDYVIGLKPRGMPVTNLSWEKNTMYNLGVDMKFFDNKLSVSSDLFTKIISGIPAARYDVLLPSEVGYDLPNENLNKNAYRGLEGMISYSDEIGELDYTIGANFTYSRFRNIETYKPRFGNSWNEYRYSIEDRWGGIWWGYQAIGRFQSEEEIRNYPIDNDGQNNRTQLPGDIIYKDVNGDGVINSMDERPIGYPTGWAPMLSYGGHIGLQWRDFDLNMDFAGASMQSWCQDYELRNPFHAGGNSPAYLLEDRWHRADPYDSNSEWIPGKYPAIRKGTSVNNGRNSDFWLKDVRFLRLKNLEFGYNLPKKVINKVGISRLRVYVSASNLFCIDNMSEYEIDPEIEARAAVVYPQQKTFMVGFNVTF